MIKCNINSCKQEAEWIYANLAFCKEHMQAIEKFPHLGVQYVCPMCNYTFKQKEDAVNCCAGQE